MTGAPLEVDQVAARRRGGRSAEELAMRAAVEAWGRARWPNSRLVHELVVGECRIDMAFVAEDHLVGIELKSSQDTLERLDKQVRTYLAHLPEVWLALAPRWEDSTGVPWTCGRVVVKPGAAPVVRRDVGVNRACTVQLLAVLWRGELAAIAVRRQLVWPKSRARVERLAGLLARALTGDEIIAEVCRELRARDHGAMGKAFWRADPAIAIADGAPPARPPPRVQLLDLRSA